MNRHQTTTMALLLMALLVTLKTSCAETPNIVLIMADDLGYGDVGCYGSLVNNTPHIDALAASGLRFTDFHSAGPMCSPTRAAMLTGQYQQRFGRIFDKALSGVDHRDRGLPHAAVTLAEMLKGQGYATGCFGKWHLGYQPPWLPTSYGFDMFRGLSSGDGDFHSHIDRSGNEDWWHNNEIEMAEGYTTDLLTRYSIEFIAAHQKQPFFLYVPHLAIHFPWQGPHDPPHRTKGKDYEADKWGVIPDPGNVAPHIKAMVESLDKSVGAIIAELQKRNLTDRTLVIFTSDNGGYLTYGPHFKNISSNGVLRGQKTDLYEGGHRVPMAIAWPGKITPGVTAQTAHSVDLLPTIARLTGISPEEITTDGIDLAPLLLAGKSLPDRTLFWRAGEQSAVRRGPWKLYRNKNITELYHLDDDLCERHDQAKEHPELVTDLRAAWNTWEGDVNKSAEQYNQ
ncbi:MAG: sulfatase-like hydrolase/transferase [Planctomycetaceae bacterium]|nr:sulfatase-like hydrolase/transferase [Planctomycetaceae bacterium]